MKYLTMMVAAIMVAFGAFADEIAVKGVGQDRIKATARKNARVDAKKNAVEKFLKKSFPNIDAKLIDGARSEYAKFVDEDIEEEGDGEFEGGEYTSDFNVDVNAEDLQSWLKENGFDPTAIGGGDKLQIFVMEKPPAKAMLKNGMDATLGNYFFQNYEVMQTRIKEAIGTMLDKLGYDIPSLETEEQFEEYKKDDPGLVGVHFDVDRGDGEFVVEQDFMKKLRNSYPKAMILRYEIQALAKEDSTLRIQLALIAVDLNGKEKKFGHADYVMNTQYAKPDMIMADFATCASRAAAKMLNEGDASAKFNKMVKSIRNEAKNAANKPKGPITVVVNLENVEKKIRTRMKINIKKAIAEAGLCPKAEIGGNGDMLTAKIKKSDITDQDGAYEAMMELMDGVGITLDDTMKNYSSDGSTLTITPSVEKED